LITRSVTLDTPISATATLAEIAEELVYLADRFSAALLPLQYSQWDDHGTVGATEALVPRLGVRRKFGDMSLRALIVAIVVSVAFAGAAAAQTAGDRGSPREQGVACPPDVKGEPPTVGGGGSSESLSDKLAESKGIICPPSGVDREMLVTPPNGGRLKVIPPPGTPGGDQSVQPK
jgi:hypothetical protein